MQARKPAPLAAGHWQHAKTLAIEWRCSPLPRISEHGRGSSAGRGAPLRWSPPWCARAVLRAACCARSHGGLPAAPQAVAHTDMPAAPRPQGSLHEGHISLVKAAKCAPAPFAHPPSSQLPTGCAVLRAAQHQSRRRPFARPRTRARPTCRARCDVVVASVYVNPTQFSANEDFDVYPRDAVGPRLRRRAPPPHACVRAGASTRAACRTRLGGLAHAHARACAHTLQASDLLKLREAGCSAVFEPTSLYAGGRCTHQPSASAPAQHQRQRACYSQHTCGVCACGVRLPPSSKPWCAPCCLPCSLAALARAQAQRAMQATLWGARGRTPTRTRLLCK